MAESMLTDKPIDFTFIGYIAMYVIAIMLELHQMNAVCTNVKIKVRDSTEITTKY